MMHTPKQHNKMFFKCGCQDKHQNCLCWLVYKVQTCFEAIIVSPLKYLVTELDKPYTNPQPNVNMLVSGDFCSTGKISALPICVDTRSESKTHQSSGNFLLDMNSCHWDKIFPSILVLVATPKFECCFKWQGSPGLLGRMHLSRLDKEPNI